MAAESIITNVAMLIASTIISTRRYRASMARLSTVPLQHESPLGQPLQDFLTRPGVAVPRWRLAPCRGGSSAEVDYTGLQEEQLVRMHNERKRAAVRQGV